ncbi:DUF6207 family protein [Streptomyces sp. NBC_00386]|uniref:DUF6207 family protein n=1 Tax=Streptomyces sp. NBC_00386 TaxID=2975734 RepID=UPI002E21B75E
MDPINETHASRPGLVAVDVAAADDTAPTFQQLLAADRWATVMSWLVAARLVSARNRLTLPSPFLRPLRLSHRSFDGTTADSRPGRARRGSSTCWCSR